MHMCKDARLVFLPCFACSCASLCVFLSTSPAKSNQCGQKQALAAMNGCLTHQRRHRSLAILDCREIAHLEASTNRAILGER